VTKEKEEKEEKFITVTDPVADPSTFFLITVTATVSNYDYNNDYKRLGFYQNTGCSLSISNMQHINKSS
jgi:hypothetical protein